MCAVVTRDAVFPRNRQAHPTAFVKTVSRSGVPLLVRRPQAPPAPTLGGFQADPASRPPPPPVPKRVEDSGARASQGGTFAVLPPIKTSGQRTSDDFSLTELEDISLKWLARVLKDASDKTLQALLRNLRSQDRDRDGILTTDFIKGTLRKFQIFLSPDGQKNICKKFGEKGERSPVVRYENMFAYMTKTRLEAIRAPPPKPQQDIYVMLNHLCIPHASLKKVRYKNFFSRIDGSVQVFCTFDRPGGLSGNLCDFNAIDHL
ncbi:uncharacterized protein LOC119589297 [Penaeus monodon]|uniref:uncharacterized protein LOC119589297 n=1 Tax=Penaeus monodon TaxID=6687 RepID=UPI0018A765DB|nr:uncharacterized protein LOC119589297 [Penaeus monodon]